MEQIHDLIQSGDLPPAFQISKSQTVADILNELGLTGKIFTVLVNDKRADLTSKVEPGDHIHILPKIAGGSL